MTSLPQYGLMPRERIDPDIFVVAAHLVNEMGARAAQHCRVQLVEYAAAGNHRAAAFWRQVMMEAEHLIADTGGSDLPPLSCDSV